MTKTLILGIDSLDPYVLLKHKAVLPNFARLMHESPTLLSKSVFPVDTIPAWASINTGLLRSRMTASSAGVAHRSRARLREARAAKGAGQALGQLVCERSRVRPIDPEVRQIASALGCASGPARVAEELGACLQP